MTDYYKCALDRGEYIAYISMDISKAFDCLPHYLTIGQLHAYGNSRAACTLIASYLYERKPRVQIGNAESDRQEISKGVPQGSILRPLILNIFMNDLCYFVKHGHLFIYADANSVSVNRKESNMMSRLLQSEAEPLFTKKTPSYGYRDPHDKHKTVWRPSQVYHGNPFTDKTASS